MSATMYNALRRLVKNGAVTYDDWTRWDQRPLRGLYLRGYITFTASHYLKSTTEGKAALSDYDGVPHFRTNEHRPTFDRKFKPRLVRSAAAA